MNPDSSHSVFMAEPNVAFRSRILPLPRGMRVEAAAEYVGVSESKFRELVTDGRMPPPKHVDGCRVWDRLALDRAFDELDSPEKNPFDGL